MLINGDLVRVPQGTVLLGLNAGTTMPLRVSSDQVMGIVIENKTTWEDLVKILMGDEVVLVDKRMVRLVGN